MEVQGQVPEHFAVNLPFLVGSDAQLWGILLGLAYVVFVRMILETHLSCSHFSPYPLCACLGFLRFFAFVCRESIFVLLPCVDIPVLLVIAASVVASFFAPVTSSLLPLLWLVHLGAFVVAIFTFLPGSHCIFEFSAALLHVVFALASRFFPFLCLSFAFWRLGKTSALGQWLGD